MPSVDKLHAKARKVHGRSATAKPKRTLKPPGEV
jgi:hypothetical protein